MNDLLPNNLCCIGPDQSVHQSRTSGHSQRSLRRDSVHIYIRKFSELQYKERMRVFQEYLLNQRSLIQ